MGGLARPEQDKPEVRFWADSTQGLAGDLKPDTIQIAGRECNEKRWVQGLLTLTEAAALRCLIQNSN